MKTIILVIYPYHTPLRQSRTEFVRPVITEIIKVVANSDLKNKVRGLEFQAVIGLEHVDEETRQVILTRVR